MDDVGDQVEGWRVAGWPDGVPAGEDLGDDDAWDRFGDRELDALAVASEVRPGPPRPWEPPAAAPPPPGPEPDWQLAMLAPDTVGEFLRACRASAGLSQRRLADLAGVRQTTVARIETGHHGDVRLSTLARLAEACEVLLVGTTAGHVPGAPVPLLETDRDQRHRDRGDRMLPAHLANHPRPRYVSFPEHNDRPYTPRRFRMTAARDARDV